MDEQESSLAVGPQWVNMFPWIHNQQGPSTQSISNVRSQFARDGSLFPSEIIGDAFLARKKLRAWGFVYQGLEKDNAKLTRWAPPKNGNWRKVLDRYTSDVHLVEMRGDTPVVQATISISKGKHGYEFSMELADEE